MMPAIARIKDHRVVTHAIPPPHTGQLDITAFFMRRSFCVLPEQLNQFVALSPLDPLTVAFEGVSCQDEFIHCSHSFL
jgi:hypothetical protein